MEPNKGSDIVVVACQSKKDCLRNIRALPCSASVVKCINGYCSCNRKNENSGILFLFYFFIIEYYILIYKLNIYIIFVV